jgi:hypothetical protein
MIRTYQKEYPVTRFDQKPSVWVVKLATEIKTLIVPIIIKLLVLSPMDENF